MNQIILKDDQQQLASMVFFVWPHCEHTNSTSLHPSIKHGTQHNKQGVIITAQQIAAFPTFLLGILMDVAPHIGHLVPSPSSLIWIIVCFGGYGCP